MRRSRAWLVLLPALLLVQGLVPRRALAHFPPPVYVSLQVGDEDVRVRVIANREIFRDWFGLDGGVVGARGEDLTREQRQAIETAIQDLVGVRIDRMPVRGTAQSVHLNHYVDHEQEWEYVNVVVAYAAMGLPRQVEFTWKQFETRIGYSFLTMDAELKAVGETTFPLFSREEPGYTWHRPLETPPPPEVVLPTPVPPPTIGLPVPTALFVLLALGLVLRLRGRARWIGGATALGVAALLLNVLVVSIELPGGGFERPKDAEAVYIFETLLKNVYRAFDEETEDRIYDTLEKSVTGGLLETVYLEVHQGLIMQDHGGAVCEVQKVDLRETELLPAEDPEAPWFEARATWRVEGLVGHYGHTHLRVNEYEAAFKVALDATGWKIADMEVLSQLRIEANEDEAAD